MIRNALIPSILCFLLLPPASATPTPTGAWNTIANDPQGDVSFASDYWEIYAPTPSVDILEISYSDNDTMLGISLRVADLGELETYNAAIFVHHSLQFAVPRTAPAATHYEHDPAHRYFGLYMTLWTGLWADLNGYNERKHHGSLWLNDIGDCETESITASCLSSQEPLTAYSFDDDWLTVWVNRTGFLEFVPSLESNTSIEVRSEAWLAPCTLIGLLYSCSANRAQALGLDVAPHNGMEPVRDSRSDPVSLNWNTTSDAAPTEFGGNDSLDHDAAPANVPSLGILLGVGAGLAVAVVAHRRRT